MRNRKNSSLDRLAKPGSAQQPITILIARFTSRSAHKKGMTKTTNSGRLSGPPLAEVNVPTLAGAAAPTITGGSPKAPIRVSGRD